jgi:hypothetical protein
MPSATASSRTSWEADVMTATAELKPKREIRRFDIFAEFRKQEQAAKEMPEDEAMGYGLWVAKVVASRHHGESSSKSSSDNGDARRQLVNGKWRTLGDEPQTDAMFDHEIVDRMGRTFYRRVFAPSIRRARKDGKSYEEIRDALRKGWKPATH